MTALRFKLVDEASAAALTCAWIIAGRAFAGAPITSPAAAIFAIAIRTVYQISISWRQWLTDMRRALETPPRPPAFVPRWSLGEHLALDFAWAAAGAIAGGVG